MSSSLAGEYNFTIDQGSDFSLQIDLTDSEDAPIDLADYTAKLQMRVNASSSTALLTLDDEGGLILNSPDTGSLLIEISSTASSALTPGSYVYDLEITDTNTSLVTRLIRGALIINAEVTR